MSADREDWPVHQPEAFDAPIPGRQWFSGCDPDRPRVRPDETCESCGGKACPECGRENCPTPEECMPTLAEMLDDLDPANRDYAHDEDTKDLNLS